MAPFRMPKYSVPISLFGTAVGLTILLKDSMRGSKYKGDERIAGKTVIITGANTGIGKETARELANRGAKVILACRNMKKCEVTKEELITDTANLNVHCQHCDLSSLESIHRFADHINQNERHVDILINNAGVMRCPKSVTEDGFETQLGVNHLGHFKLTQLLLDKLKQSAPSRIIVLSSLAHTRGEINFDDLNSGNEYHSGAAYNQSKLANILFMKELDRRLQGTGVTVNALHPGIVKTEIGRHLPIANSYISGTILSPLSWMFMKTSVQGCQTTLHCALSPDLEHVSGKYFSDCKVKAVAAAGEDENVAKRLWAISERWTQST